MDLILRHSITGRSILGHRFLGQRVDRQNNASEGRASEGSYCVTLSRHDNHSLELKSDFPVTDLGLSGELALYLFVPKSVQLTQYSKSDWASDFKSRVRLAIPRHVVQDETRLKSELQSLSEACWDLRRADDSNRATDYSAALDCVFRAARHVGAVMGEMIKIKAGLHQRRIFMAHSLSSAPIHPSAELCTIASEVSEVAAWVSAIRGTLGDFGQNLPPVLSLLESYTHAVYVDYLGTVRAEFEQMLALKQRYPSEKYSEGWQTLLATLTQLQKDESVYRNVGRPDGLNDQVATQSGRPQLAPDPDGEIKLFKQSQLKKFFQSEMFVDLSRRETIRKYTEPVAIGATGLAALAVSAIERLGHSPVHGLGGLSVVAAGVTFYVLKDRIKDRGKQYLFRKISRFVPDLERELVAEKRPVGRVREWFEVLQTASVPVHVRNQRMAGALSDAESHLPEDVLYFRRLFELKPIQTAQREGRSEVHEVLRINLERYLKHLDDPYKSVRVLDEHGNFKVQNSHRVYHFYICIEARTMGEAPGLHQTYRIVMDKNGVSRVEAIRSAQAKFFQDLEYSRWDPSQIDLYTPESIF